MEIYVDVRKFFFFFWINIEFRYLENELRSNIVFFLLFCKIK